MPTPSTVMPSRISIASPRLPSRPLKQTLVGDGQVHRAKRVLSPLVTAMLLDDNNAATKGAVRTRSFSHRVENTNTTIRST
ncbi:hypothetical protein D0Y65_015624 [Glycine soja]|uniref:Uncharacterized protein n=1 Tax=Glycine soja TaxID=3848 RepID=A0A445KDS8_GLYSO|nr:hypothetical protein D0Y65_015624 [Glycine soja]